MTIPFQPNGGVIGNMGNQLWIFLLGATLLMAWSCIALADQNQTCRLRGGKQQADYHCPDNYDAIVAGEGTDRCDGGCYKRGNISSLSSAVDAIFVRRFGLNLSNKSLQYVTENLQQKGYSEMYPQTYLPSGETIPEAFLLRIR